MEDSCEEISTDLWLGNAFANKMIRRPLTAEIIEFLRSGNPDVRVTLNHEGDRVVLERYALPSPEIIRSWKFEKYVISEAKPVVAFRGVKWHGIEFVECELPSLRMFDSYLENCTFNKCKLHDLRLWNMHISHVELNRCDLRDAALGSIENNKINHYNHVTFCETDFRGCSFMGCSFQECVFDTSRMKELDMSESQFENCKFIGELNDVTFAELGYSTKNLFTNRMDNVDFSQAMLRSVDFRNL